MLCRLLDPMPSIIFHPPPFWWNLSEGGYRLFTFNTIPQSTNLLLPNIMSSFEILSHPVSRQQNHSLANSCIIINFVTQTPMY